MVGNSAITPESGYLRAVFGEEKLPASTKVQVVGKGVTSPRIWVDHVREIEQFREVHSNTPGTACFSPALFDSKQDRESSVISWNALVLDFDGKSYVSGSDSQPDCRGAFMAESLIRVRRAEQALGEPTAVIYSGNGAHAAWVFRSPVEINDTNRTDIKSTFKSIARRFDADSACATLSHYFRIPGTLNSKGHTPVRTRILRLNPDARITLEVLRSVVPRPPNTAAPSPPLPTASSVEHHLRPFQVLRRLKMKGLAIDRNGRAGSWMASCPSHTDRDPSLSIGTGDRGRALLNCFAGCSFEEVLDALNLTRPKPKLPIDAEELTSAKSAKKQNQATLVLGLLEDLPLFCSPDGTAYATVQIWDHEENWRLAPDVFASYVADRFVDRFGTVPTTVAIKDALRVLEHRAKVTGVVQRTFVRVAGTDDAVYLDLANRDREIVEIRPGGWKIIKNPPVRFVRPEGMLPLPRPTKGTPLAKLRSFLNAADDNQWALMAGWLIGALQPEGPFAILIVTGEQGAAKSTAQKVLRLVIDPNSTPLRAEPSSERDLMIAAQNGRVISFDNLSRFRPWLSDALCRTSTGGGYTIRKNYTDMQEVHFNAKRPILLNGIEDFATRSDLLDRAILADLPRIPEEGRRLEREFWREFRQAHPGVLGALCSAVSTALRNLGQTVLDAHPRLADFAQWVVAAEPALGLSPGTFLDAYLENRNTARRIALEASAIAGPVIEIALRGRWDGTATDLLQELNFGADEQTRRQWGWPKTPRKLAGDLRRIAPDLRAQGIEVAFDRESGGNRTRLIHILPASESAPQNADPAPVQPGPSSSKTHSIFPTEPSHAKPARPVAQDAVPKPDGDPTNPSEDLLP